ncbi:hemin uptake protein HemP [uncultured Enterovirga sp.]|uniref:hemin uptake protein HemP n=1 Tax=uncultured Enterovirga sp. TaxID=2026352 RepID=UPI0035C952A4
MVEQSPEQKIDPDRGSRTGQQPKSVDTVALFGGSREVVLVHRGENYRLRLTQSGKLLLTK